jgi:hypothetical protein
MKRRKKKMMLMVRSDGQGDGGEQVHSSGANQN